MCRRKILCRRKIEILVTLPCCFNWEVGWSTHRTLPLMEKVTLATHALFALALCTAPLSDCALFLYFLASHIVCLQSSNTARVLCVTDFPLLRFPESCYFFPVVWRWNARSRNKLKMGRGSGRGESDNYGDGGSYSRKRVRRSTFNFASSHWMNNKWIPVAQ